MPGPILPLSGSPHGEMDLPSALSVFIARIQLGNITQVPTRGASEPISCA